MTNKQMEEDINWLKGVISLFILCMGIVLVVLTPFALITEEDTNNPSLKAVHSPEQMIGVPEDKIMKKGDTYYIIQD